MTEDTKTPEAVVVAADVGVPANPAMINWPQDKWGYTSELRKAGLKLAAGIQGQDDKHALALATLATLARHIHARHQADKKAKAERMEWIEKDAQARIARLETYTRKANKDG